jgi:hypothetical protein
MDEKLFSELDNAAAGSASKKNERVIKEIKATQTKAFLKCINFLL